MYSEKIDLHIIDVINKLVQSMLWCRWRSF